MRRNHFALASLVMGLALTAAQASKAATILTNTDSTDAPSEAEEAVNYVFTNLRAGDSTIPSNSSTDLANGITPVLISGTIHPVSGPITKLTDGVGANNTDDPANNFFGDNGNMVFRISLNGSSSITSINSYSWHHGDGRRAPQRYDVYGSNTAVGTAGFNVDDFNNPGYSLIATVNTGATLLPSQQGVSIIPSAGPNLGAFRHFIFNAFTPTGPEGTFYSEVDIIGVPVPEPSCLALLGLGSIALVRYARRRQRG